MFRLPFKCLNCDYDFKTIDEHLVICPNCNSDDVIVEWARELDGALKEVDMIEHGLLPKRTAREFLKELKENKEN